MAIHRLSDTLVDDIQGDLKRLRARCYVAVKDVPRGRWSQVGEPAATLREALLRAEGSSDSAEVCVFLEHYYFGGIMVWTSLAPDVANTFDDYECPEFVQGVGAVEGYTWIEDRRANVSAVLPALRHEAAGQRVMVSSFDSGPLRASPEELDLGWTQLPSGALSPPLNESVDIPWEGFDEWWVFPSVEPVIPLPEYEPFVNMDRWSMRSPADLTADFDPTWEKDVFDWLPAHQKRFWSIVATHRPSTYVANGSRLIVVSNSDPVIGSTREYLENWSTRFDR